MCVFFYKDARGNRTFRVNYFFPPRSTSVSDKLKKLTHPAHLPQSTPISMSTPVSDPVMNSGSFCPPHQVPTPALHSSHHHQTQIAGQPLACSPGLPQTGSTSVSRNQLVVAPSTAQYHAKISVQNNPPGPKQPVHQTVLPQPPALPRITPRPQASAPSLSNQSNALKTKPPPSLQVNALIRKQSKSKPPVAASNTNSPAVPASTASSSVPVSRRVITTPSSAAQLEETKKQTKLLLLIEKRLNTVNENTVRVYNKLNELLMKAQDKGQRNNLHLSKTFKV